MSLYTPAQDVKLVYSTPLPINSPDTHFLNYGLSYSPGANGSYYESVGPQWSSTPPEYLPAFTLFGSPDQTPYLDQGVYCPQQQFSPFIPPTINYCEWGNEGRATWQNTHFEAGISPGAYSFYYPTEAFKFEERQMPHDSAGKQRPSNNFSSISKPMKCKQQSSSPVWRRPSDSENNRKTSIDKLHPLLCQLKITNNYNPVDFDVNPLHARFFVIKSYSEDDVHRSIKYNTWCSTETGNRKLNAAYKDMLSVGGAVYLFFSVNSSGHFCGLVKMTSEVDFNSQCKFWCQDKWKGSFSVCWIFVKDVPNSQLRHIRLENNENKPVTNSRDSQEIPYEKGKMMLKLIASFRSQTSIFDDFSHYERREFDGHDENLSPH